MKAVKVVSYNVENGVNAQKIAENISIFHKMRVDVICLQETRKIPNRNFIETSISSALGNNWKNILFLDENSPINGLGLSIFWNSKRLRLKKKQLIFLPRLNYLNIVEKILCYFLVPKNIPPQRGAISLTFSSGKKQFQIINVHLDWMGGMKHRLTQLQHAIYSSNNYKIPQIICGDFNTVGPAINNSQNSDAISSILGSEYKEVFPKIPYTHKIGVQNDPIYPLVSMIDNTFKLFHLHFAQKLDYVWYKKLKILEAKMLEIPGSDHFPLIAKFKFLN